MLRYVFQIANDLLKAQALHQQADDFDSKDLQGRTGPVRTRRVGLPTPHPQPPRFLPRPLGACVPCSLRGVQVPR